MKKIITLTLAALFFVSCSSPIEGEGAATGIKEIETGDFQKIEVDCNCYLTLIPSETSKLVIESHENLIENTEVKSKKKSLKISEKKRVEDFDLYNLNLYTSTPLSDIVLSGKARMKTSGTLTSDKLSLTAKDETSVSQAHMEVGDADFDFRGQSKINISGTAVNLSLNADGKSDADLSKLICVDINFKAFDYSALTLYAMKNLKGRAHDNSVVFYLGNPSKSTTEKDKAIIQQSTNE